MHKHDENRHEQFYMLSDTAEQWTLKLNIIVKRFPLHFTLCLSKYQFQFQRTEGQVFSESELVVNLFGAALRLSVQFVMDKFSISSTQCSCVRSFRFNL